MFYKSMSSAALYSVAWSWRQQEPAVECARGCAGRAVVADVAGSSQKNCAQLSTLDMHWFAAACDQLVAAACLQTSTGQVRERPRLCGDPPRS
jgi:hypothetical protein